MYMYTVLHFGDRRTTEMRVKTPADDPKTLSQSSRRREKWQKLLRLIMVLHVYIFETILSCLSVVRSPIAALAVNRAVRWPCKTH